MAQSMAIIGTGVIGAGWASRALAHGLDVTAWDPAPDAEGKLRAAIDRAWDALTQTGLAESYGIVTRYINRVGLGEKDPFACPLLEQRSAINP